MTEEIKEILDDLENVSYLPNISYQLSQNKVKELYDYITNLKQELQITQEKWDKDKQWVECRTKEWLDYKSRCEKAIDKIQYIIDYGFDYDGFNTIESLKGLIDMLVDYARESKNILQNGSDEE